MKFVFFYAPIIFFGLLACRGQIESQSNDVAQSCQIDASRLAGERLVRLIDRGQVFDARRLSVATMNQDGVETRLTPSPGGCLMMSEIPGSVLWVQKEGPLPDLAVVDLSRFISEESTDFVTIELAEHAYVESSISCPQVSTSSLRLAIDQVSQPSLDSQEFSLEIHGSEGQSARLQGAFLQSETGIHSLGFQLPSTDQREAIYSYTVRSKRPFGEIAVRSCETRVFFGKPELVLGDGIRLDQTNYFDFGQLLDLTADQSARLEYCYVQSPDEDCVLRNENLVRLDQAGSWLLRVQARNTPGVVSSTLHLPVTIDNQEPQVAAAWDRVYNEGSFKILPLPEKTFQASISLSDDTADRDELLQRLQCRVRFIGANTRPIGNDIAVCISSRCAGESMDRFVSCDPKIKFRLDEFPANEDGSVGGTISLDVRVTDQLGKAKDFSLHQVADTRNFPSWKMHDLSLDQEKVTYQSLVEHQDEIYLVQRQGFARYRKDQLPTQVQLFFGEDHSDFKWLEEERIRKVESFASDQLVFMSNSRLMVCRSSMPESFFCNLLEQGIDEFYDFDILDSRYLSYIKEDQLIIRKLSDNNILQSLPLPDYRRNDGVKRVVLKDQNTALVFSNSRYFRLPLRGDVGNVELRRYEVDEYNQTFRPSPLSIRPDFLSSRSLRMIGSFAYRTFDLDTEKSLENRWDDFAFRPYMRLVKELPHPNGTHSWILTRNSILYVNRSMETWSEFSIDEMRLQTEPNQEFELADFILDKKGRPLILANLVSYNELRLPVDSDSGSLLLSLESNSPEIASLPLATMDYRTIVEPFVLYPVGIDISPPKDGKISSGILYTHASFRQETTDKKPRFDFNSGIRTVRRGADGTPWLASESTLLKMENGRFFSILEKPRRYLSDFVIGEHGPEALIWYLNESNFFYDLPVYELEVFHPDGSLRNRYSAAEIMNIEAGTHSRYHINRDQDGNIWMTEIFGQGFINSQGEAFGNREAPQLCVDDGCWYQHADGRVWVTDSAQVFEYRGFENYKRIDEQFPEIPIVFQEAAGELWMLSNYSRYSPSRLYRFDRIENTWVLDENWMIEPQNNGIAKIFADDRGRLVVVGFHQDFAIYDGIKWKSYKTPRWKEDLGFRTISTLAEMGFQFAEGIDIFDHARNNISRFFYHQGQFFMSEPNKGLYMLDEMYRKHRPPSFFRPRMRRTDPINPV